MKCNKLAFRWRWWGRAPYGARGLKLLRIGQLPQQLGSRPVWGAWIEIYALHCPITLQLSRPVWGAWIEIRYKSCSRSMAAVAPRMGRVD